MSDRQTFEANLHWKQNELYLGKLYVGCVEHIQDYFNEGPGNTRIPSYYAYLVMDNPYGTDNGNFDTLEEARNALYKAAVALLTNHEVDDTKRHDDKDDGKHDHKDKD